MGSSWFNRGRSLLYFLAVFLGSPIFRLFVLWLGRPRARECLRPDGPFRGMCFGRWPGNSPTSRVRCALSAALAARRVRGSRCARPHEPGQRSEAGII